MIHLLPYSLPLPCSYSSRFTTAITNFRNFDDEEIKGGINRPIPAKKLLIRIAVAEIGYSLAALTALIETLVYAIFFPIYEIIKLQNIDVSVILLLSSAKTVQWTINNLYYNLVKLSLPINEPSASLCLLVTQINKVCQDVYNLLQIRSEIETHRPLEFFIQNGNYLLCHMKGLLVLGLILKKPENLKLKENLKTDRSPEAIDLLSFLTVIECVLTHQPYLGFFNTDAKNLIIRYQKDLSKEKLLQFEKKYKQFLTIQNFTIFDLVKIQNDDDKEIYLRLKEISIVAIKGSHFFCPILNTYLQIPDLPNESIIHVK